MKRNVRHHYDEMDREPLLTRMYTIEVEGEFFRWHVRKERKFNIVTVMAPKGNYNGKTVKMYVVSKA